jgi:NAD(P)-dependent dehydrogenase (short-subunit alcohol dehydrogenase family)
VRLQTNWSNDMAEKQSPRTIIDSGFSNWTADKLPDLKGKLYVITGGNSGIGFEAAKILGKAGADIVLACRSIDKAESAAQDLRTMISGKADVVQLDLSDLASVRKAAAQVRADYHLIDGLINNAGLMQTPQMQTADGFEMQLGTNHLGHFLWTGLLIDMVEAAAGRVVTVSSIAHLNGKIDFDDLMGTQNYSPTRAYFQSKGANLMFALDLDRRLQAVGSNAISIACHPGYSNTNLQNTGPTGIFALLYKVLNPLFAQASDAGALPTVLAAAGTEAKRGAYYGPTKRGETRGPVSDAKVAPYVRDQADAARLWAESEKLVGFEWDLARG